MIKNRNIAKDAFIDASKIAGAGDGEVYYVAINTSKAYERLKGQVPSGHLFAASAAKADVAINAALSACVADRDDKVIVMPGGYTLTATITMSKSTTHLICPAGLGCEVGAKNACRITAYAGTAAITITAASCEVAGFYLKNANSSLTISLGAGSHCTHIHHNHFPLIWSSGAQKPAIQSAGTATMQNIERNYIFNYTGGQSLTCADGLIHIDADGYLSRVCNNIIQVGAGGIATYGIHMSCSNGLIAYNVITESGGGGTAPAGTVTAAVSGTASTSFVGNRCAVSTSGFSDASGSTGVSYTDNTNGVTNAKSGSADIMTAQLET